jgi:hypothetical protein
MNRKEKQTTEKEIVNLKKLELARIKLKIIGKSPYIPEPMDFDMLERYDKKRSNQVFDKDVRSEEDKLKTKFFYFDEKKQIYGIPVRCFYKSMINASSYLFERSEGGKRNIREGVTILGDVVELKYKNIKVLRHWGKSSGISKTPKLILRNAFFDWSCEIEIEYNKNQLSAEQIINCLNYAGFYSGVGGFRKQNSGNYGCFSVKI